MVVCRNENYTHYHVNAEFQIINKNVSADMAVSATKMRYVALDYLLSPSITLTPNASQHCWY